MAEQIGGQIFIDCWGLVSPGKEERAARLARAAQMISPEEAKKNGQWYAPGPVAVTEEQIAQVSAVLS